VPEKRLGRLKSCELNDVGYGVQIISVGCTSKPRCLKRYRATTGEGI